MERFKSFKDIAQDGDIIVCQHNIIKGVREVVVDGDGVVCEGHFFKWNHWFEVNTPIMFRDPKKEPITDLDENKIKFFKLVDPCREFPSPTAQRMKKRFQSMGWWCSLSIVEQMEIANNYYSRDHLNLTGREIQKIYEEKFGE
jgi:hypothetical protein